MEQPITIFPYNPNWINQFETHSKKIKHALGENCIEIHHVGSTSVPGLAAKPIIDIIPVVNDIEEVNACVDAMQQTGYESKGEAGMLFRHFFQKETDTDSANIHIFEKGSPEIDRHLKFRDWLSMHPTDRDAYASLKETLAHKFPNDILNYCLAKEDFVTKIDKQTGCTGLRIVETLTHKEWESAKTLRQKYFFDDLNIADPFTWSFNHIDHKHLSLYNGSELIGYCHIQLWENNRAAIRIIAIEETLRNQGIGNSFLSNCIRWLKQKKISSIHAESNLKALPFYKKNGFTEMPFYDPSGEETHPNDTALGLILQ